MEYTGIIAALYGGRDVTLRPKGQSMTPLIRSGQKIVVSPIRDDLRIGDIVLCRVAGHYRIHKILAIEGSRYQIGNNHGHIDGWTSRFRIYGRVTQVG